jgi:hypothetical protein
MLDRDNKMLDINKWNWGNMYKNLKTWPVLGILICLFGVGRIFDRAILEKQQAKNYAGTGNSCNRSDFSSKRNSE